MDGDVVHGLATLLTRGASQRLRQTSGLPVDVQLQKHR